MKLPGIVVAPKECMKNPENIIKAAHRMLDMTAENIRIDFQVTTQTWKGKPEFFVKKEKENVRLVGTHNKIYRFITRGTRIRYATMTKDFVAKTVPGKIYSRVGRGGLAFVDKRKPRPGIQAREYEEAAYDKWIDSGKIAILMQRAVNTEVKKMMQGK